MNAVVHTERANHEYHPLLMYAQCVQAYYG